MFELWCLSDWCDDMYRLDSIMFELRSVSDLCADWLQAGQYKV